jgi:pimeloyl-ACP methyl ester carboxylesterase
LTFTLMLDGLSDPPIAWSELRAAIAKTGQAVVMFDRRSHFIEPALTERLKWGDTIQLIGHSFGGSKAVELSHKYPVERLILIDAVHEPWQRRKFVSGAKKSIAFTRRWLFGLPPSYGLENGENVPMVAGHNSIVGKAIPQILAWLNS